MVDTINMVTHLVTDVHEVMHEYECAKMRGLDKTAWAQRESQFAAAPDRAIHERHEHKKMTRALSEPLTAKLERAHKETQLLMSVVGRVYVLHAPRFFSKSVRLQGDRYQGCHKENLVLARDWLVPLQTSLPQLKRATRDLATLSRRAARDQAANHELSALGRGMCIALGGCHTFMNQILTFFAYHANISDPADVG